MICRHLVVDTVTWNFEYALHLLQSIKRYCFTICEGAQWLSGRVLDSRPRVRGFEPHRRHCVVVLEPDIFILAKYWFNPGRRVPVFLLRFISSMEPLMKSLSHNMSYQAVNTHIINLLLCVQC